jgi:Na+-transporting methylmalonyl-CoA/oxaloacetate decarboxylase gamma subunit
MKNFLRNNGLSVVFFVLFLLSMLAQIMSGLQQYNKEMQEAGGLTVNLTQYLHSGHFIQATFENWESEFLQMALFVVLTIFFQQKGSSESKDFDKTEETDREPSAQRKGAPWPVKKGGWILTLYKNSLTWVLLFLFLISFVLHFYGSLKDENLKLGLKGQPAMTTWAYMLDARFWFESFQNWQSEFLSVFAIVILSIYFRQKGSPQSKPVDAPHSETGE